jgi:hypothetical protein
VAAKVLYRPGGEAQGKPRVSPPSLSLSAALFNAPSPLQALDFVFHLFGDLPDVFAQVLARAQGLQCMHCV